MKFIRTTLAAVALTGLAGIASAQQPAAATPPATTTSQDSSAAVPATPPRAAASDLVVGAPVMGSDGQPVGTIETADATGATVTTGTARGRLALDAFYKNENGLLIGYTQAQINARGAPVTPAATPAAPAAAPANTAAPQN